MADLHKALTDECDKRERHREADLASFSWVDEEMPAMVPVSDLRELLAEHPPTAPHPREPMLGGPDGADQAAMMEQGRRLASERDDLVAAGVDPAELVVPLAPPTAPVVDREALDTRAILDSGILADAATVLAERDALREQLDQMFQAVIDGCREAMAKVTRLACPTCEGSIRETVGMVCQTCGKDYGPPPVLLEPGENVAIAAARAQLDRGELPDRHTAAVCVVALIRIVDGGGSDG